MMRVCTSRVTIMGTAKAASSHSFRVIRAMARKIFRQTFPLMSMACMGSSIFRQSLTLRMINATIMAPI